MASIKINGDTSGSTTITAPATGSDETIELSTALASKLTAADQTVVQIVRATDSTLRSTTSTSFVDITGMSVTITPTSASNAVLLLGILRTGMEASLTTNMRANVQITDSSNSAVTGTSAFGMQNFDRSSGVTIIQNNLVAVAYSTPATTSATTYKMRMAVSDSNCTLEIRNNNQAGQLYAIEVAT